MLYTWTSNSNHKLCSVTATDAGLNFLDAIDFYINFILLFIGLIETFAAGWMSNIDQQFESLGHKIVLTYMLGTFGSVILACSLWFGIDGDGAVWSGFLALILGYVFTFGLTYMFCKQKMSEEPGKWTTSTILYEVLIKNVIDFRDELQSVCGWIPTAWAVMMRHFIPQVLLILFINLSVAETDAGEPKFGNYGGYLGWPYQVLGIGTVVIAFVMFTVGLMAPELYLGADLYALQKREASNAGENGNKKLWEEEAESKQKLSKEDQAEA